jgi:hypothetical protein
MQPPIGMLNLNTLAVVEDTIKSLLDLLRDEHEQSQLNLNEDKATHITKVANYLAMAKFTLMMRAKDD